jgi:phosphoinositide-3-kinase, regulatory subunit 4
LSNYAERSEQIQHENISRSLRRSADASGLLLVTQIICSSIRHLRCPQSKVISLMLLTRFGLLLGDNIILQRVVPFVMLCIEDPIAIVRATSIRCLRALLSAVTEISQIDSNIFKDFLFPILNNVIARDTEAIVRVAFAESIGRFAETSMRFLDAARFNTQIKLNPSPAPTQVTQTPEGETTSVNQTPAALIVEGSYDTQVSLLHDQVSKWIRDLVLDGTLSNDRSDGRARSSLNSHSSIVKRAILEDIVRLCVFFGKQERIMDLFAQLLAYVNHTVCPTYRSLISPCSYIATSR